MAKRAHERPDDVADVEIGAAVKAKELRFNRKPQVEVEFEGEDEGELEPESDSHTERENLPDEVEPGVTYRDVRVRWRAGARLRSNPPRKTK